MSAAAVITITLAAPTPGRADDMIAPIQIRFAGEIDGQRLFNAAFALLSVMQEALKRDGLSAPAGFDAAFGGVAALAGVTRCAFTRGALAPTGGPQ